ncbi:MAG: hypothetical protein JSR18_16680 [Proteobacteria bacterium]|nr:hypothetical protein [Pseudomonadota bacterium]
MPSRANRLATGLSLPAIATRRACCVGVLALLVAGCVSNAPKPDGAPPAAGATDTAAPAPPPAPACQPEPFCMSDCKRQGYPQGYCNLRCGC